MDQRISDADLKAADANSKATKNYIEIEKLKIAIDEAEKSRKRHKFQHEKQFEKQEKVIEVDHSGLVQLEIDSKIMKKDYENDHKRIRTMEADIKEIKKEISDASENIAKAAVIIERECAENKEHIRESGEYRKKIDFNSSICKKLSRGWDVTWTSALKTIGAYIPVAICIYVLFVFKELVEKIKM